MEIPSNISWKTINDKVVAVNVTTGDYYTLNATASAIWNAIADNKSREEIVEIIKEEFEDVPVTDLEADIDAQLHEWKELALIN